MCIFCGSSSGKEPAYARETLKLADFLVAGGISVVYGGGGAGLMGILARRMMERGGSVSGVIPSLIHSKVSDIQLSETILTDDMHQRKSIMYDMSDAFTALPGGIGTIEEISEAYTWQQLGYHSKPVSLYNINGYFNRFTAFLEHSVSQGFIKKIHFDRLIVEKEPEALMNRLESYSGDTVDKWS